MIINLERFIQEEQPYWDELEQLLERMQEDAAYTLDLEGVRRFHFLYHRASASLARLTGFSADQELKIYLESLVGKAFARIHESRQKQSRPNPVKWFFNRFPQAFRRHILAFWISFLIMALGNTFGMIAIFTDQDAKGALMPFSHLMQDPSERVAKEEAESGEHLEGHKSSFAGFLMANNIKVSILAMGLGMTWGIGTIIVLFANGVYLGATCMDYILAGQGTFLTGWLLPHGSIEIPAILLAGQAGLVLAGALIGWGRSVSLKMRLRTVMPDLVTLIGGISVMLVWAGFIEAFLSQYHEPVIAYEVKITFGAIQLIALTVFLSRAGAKKNETPAP